MKNLLLRSTVLAALAWAAPGHAQTFVAGPTATLPSTNTGWDYITLDAKNHRLFIARRLDGLTIFDTATNTMVGTMDNSKNANGVVLVPEANRGYVAMTDGTMLSFDMTTLKPIARIDLREGELNQGFYDPATKRVHMVVGAQQQPKSTWISIDGTTGAIVGKTVFETKKMDDPAVDGHGLIFSTMRDQNKLMRLNSADLKIQDTFPLGDCVQPVAVEYDHEAKRVLIACRGDKPVFIAIDPTNGKIGATLPIGRGVDGMVHDEKNHLLITANGVDGTMTVIRQEGPDSYKLVENIMTRPMARVLQMDPATRRLYTVTASHSQAAPTDGKPAPIVYHPDSFTVMTYNPAK